MAQIAILFAPALYHLAQADVAWVTIIASLAILGVSIAAQRNPAVKIGLLHDHESIYAGERHRLGSSAYIHGGALHLIFNLLAFFSFGRALEGYFLWRFGSGGPLLYAAILVGGAFLTGSLQYAGERYLGSMPSLGASAVVLLVVSASIVLDPGSLILLLFIPLPGWLFLAVFTGVTVYSMLKHSKAVDSFMTFGAGRVNHLGHLTGIVAGIALGCLLLV